MSLISKLKEIDSLRATKLRTGRAFEAEAIIRIDEWTFAARLPNGQWWTNWKDVEKFAFPAYATTGWKNIDLVYALAKLGIITRCVAEQYEQECRDNRKNSDERLARESLSRLATRFGYTLSKK